MKSKDKLKMTFAELVHNSTVNVIFSGPISGSTNFMLRNKDIKNNFLCRKNKFHINR